MAAAAQTKIVLGARPKGVERVRDQYRHAENEQNSYYIRKHGLPCAASDTDRARPHSQTEFSWRDRIAGSLMIFGNNDGSGAGDPGGRAAVPGSSARLRTAEPFIEADAA